MVVGMDARTTEDWPLGRVLLVGTFHFNSNRNVVDNEVDDMRSERRQAELEALTLRLSRYEPTKVLLERPYAETEQINAAYTAYCQGTWELDRGEVEQVGFRLAARLGHDQIYPVDILHDWWNPGLDTLMARKPELGAMWEAWVATAREHARREDTEIAERNLTDLLADRNTPQQHRRTIAPYLTLFPRLIDGPDYVGADMTGNWYHRNIRIYANILRVAEPGDRLLILYGAGHIPILWHLFEASGEFALDDPQHYLTAWTKQQPSQPPPPNAHDIEGS
jgi:hypothetical protein